MCDAHDATVTARIRLNDCIAVKPIRPVPLQWVEDVDIVGPSIAGVFFEIRSQL
jgi:hypothetical protein